MDDAPKDPRHWIKQAEKLLGKDHPVTVWHRQHAGHDIHTAGGGFQPVVLTCRDCGVSISLG